MPPDDASLIPSETATDRAPKPPHTYLRQYELVEKVKAYHTDADEHALNAGYVYAVAKHGHQKRASGDPYFSHPVAVAGLLADMKLDEDTIIAGLLHDTVEDTDASLEDIRDLFGGDVAGLVNGVTKLGEIEYNSLASKQAENFQKFILATIGDIRVLLVKLADRLHNMRTLHFIKKPEKRARIAYETMDLYAPLARRIGLYNIASEMEDIAFSEINPQARRAIVEEIERISEEGANTLALIEHDLYALLESVDVKGRIKSRRKQPYSIWRKLERKSISFQQVFDIFAFRIIIENKEDCYKVLGAAHQQWQCIEERFRDFISVPKPNGYQSLHTTVRAAGNRVVELQIRDENMHQTAENGVAAHWEYKDSVYGYNRESAIKAGLDAEKELQTFADLLDHSEDPDEFLEHAKLEMYRDHVFCFTPKGRLIIIAQGAMPLDFAYAVHTAIGDTFRGVKINNVNRSRDTELQNGDIVEIIHGKKAAPVGGWENLAITAKARSAQQRLARARKRQDMIILGKKILDNAFRSEGIDPVSVNLTDLVEKANYKTLDDLYEVIGRKDQKTSSLIKLAFPGLKFSEPNLQNKITLNDENAPRLIAGRDLTLGVSLHMANCCYPLPGDRIIGVHVPEEGLIVHCINCAELAREEIAQEDWVDLLWTDLANKVGLAVGRIHLKAHNKKGVLAKLCQAVTDANASITRVETGAREEEFIDLYFDIEVEDVKRLTQILASMRSLAIVDKAERSIEARE